MADEELKNTANPSPGANSGSETALAADEALLQDLKGQVLTRDKRILSLEAQVESVGGIQAELEGVKQAHQVASAEIQRLSESLTSTLAKYKALSLAQHPEVPEEMVQGNSLEEMEASLEKATALVAKVRERIRAEQAQVPVPAGAPVRAAPNLEGLSPQEKIKLGLRR